MRKTVAITAACLVLIGCHRNNGQAAALDEAAKQSDPAGAAVLTNEADAIRANGSDANMADAGSPAQDALSNAGAATAATVGPTPPSPAEQERAAAATAPKASPHRAGEPVPQPGNH